MSENLNYTISEVTPKISLFKNTLFTQFRGCFKKLNELKTIFHA